MSSDLGVIAAELYGQVADFVALPVLQERADPIERISAALTIEAMASELVGATVIAARAEGATWKSIGELLGITRQAAFQRFGKPADPRTGEIMNAAPLANAAELARGVVDSLSTAEWDAVISKLDPAMQAALTADGLAAAWTQVVRTVGSFESRGATIVARAGDLTVTDTSLSFEAGEFVARTSFRDDGSIAGLFIIPPEAAA